jgi:hypothetical protein
VDSEKPAQDLYEKHLRVGAVIASAATTACSMLGNMNARVDHVLEEGLRLSADERAAVAAAPIDSLETLDEASIAEAWRTDLLRCRQAEDRIRIFDLSPFD